VKRKEEGSQQEDTMHSLKALVLFLALSLAAGAMPSATRAQDEQPAQTPQTPEQVAYVRMIEGEVGYLRGDDDQGQWNPAAINSPLATGDSLYASEKSRAEIQVGDSSFLRLGNLAYVGVLQNSNDIFQLKVTSGTATLRVQQLDRTYEIDTPSLAFTPQQPGEYLFDVSENGDTVVTLHEGQGVANIGQQGNETLSAPTKLKVDSATSQTVTSQDSTRDSWDQWNQQRDNLALHSQSQQNVPSGVQGADTLDQYGHWVNTPQYGAAWAPNAVDANWQPYQTGHWIWMDPYGWTWVSDEPWGWAPYHYGRWAFVSGVGWVWVPGQPGQVYAPALVAFVGTDESFGWFPLGPGEAYAPMYATGGVVFVRPVREYAFYSRAIVINRVDIYGPRYRYLHGDRVFFERATVYRGFPVRPRYENLYARRVEEARFREHARWSPPDRLRHEREVRAFHNERPVVRPFGERMREMPERGQLRSVNPYRTDPHGGVVKANVTRPEFTGKPPVAKGGGRGFEQRGTNAGPSKLGETPKAGARTFQVPANSGKPGPATSGAPGHNAVGQNNTGASATGPRTFTVPPANKTGAATNNSPGLNPAAPRSSGAPASGPRTFTVPSNNRVGSATSAASGSNPTPAHPGYAPPVSKVSPVPGSQGQARAVRPGYTPPQSRTSNIPSGSAQGSHPAPNAAGQPARAYTPPPSRTSNAPATVRPGNQAATGAQRQPAPASHPPVQQQRTQAQQPPPKAQAQPQQTKPKQQK